MYKCNLKFLYLHVCLCLHAHVMCECVPACTYVRVYILKEARRGSKIL